MSILLLVFRIIRCALPTKSSRLLNFKNAPTALTKVIHQNSCFEKSTHPIFFEKATIKGLSGSRSGDIFFNSDYNEVLKFGVLDILSVDSSVADQTWPTLWIFVKNSQFYCSFTKINRFPTFIWVIPKIGNLFIFEKLL